MSQAVTDKPYSVQCHTCRRDLPWSMKRYEIRALEQGKTEIGFTFCEPCFLEAAGQTMKIDFKPFNFLEMMRNAATMPGVAQVVQYTGVPPNQVWLADPPMDSYINRRFGKKP